MSGATTTRAAFKDTVALSRGGGAVDGVAFAQTAFFFQQRRGKLDMRSLARVDVERVIEEVDVGTLQMHLENLTFSDLCTDDMAAFTDEHFLKLFRLAQLTIEYLLNVQNALLAYSRDCEEETVALKDAAREGERRLKSRHGKVRSLKRSLKQQRHTLKTYEALLKQHENRTASSAPLPASPPQQLLHRSNAAASPGSDVLMADDGRQFVSVDYLKRKAAKAQAMSSAQRDNNNNNNNNNAAAAAAADQASRDRIRRLEQDQAARDEEWARKLEEVAVATRNSAAAGRASEDLAQVNLELAAEKQHREALEASMGEARAAHEAQVARMQRGLQEEMRKMKQLMQAELSEQRSIQQQELAAMVAAGTGSGMRAAVASAAGDLESDSDDELHDSESMGKMRRSKREMARLLAENQAKLEALEREKRSMRDQLIEQFIRRRAIFMVTVCFNGWKMDTAAAIAGRLTAQAQARVVTVVQAPEPAAKKQEEKQEAPKPKPKPTRDGKLYIPTYRFTTLPTNASLPFQDQLEIVEKANGEEEVRIPAAWELSLTLERPANKGGNATIAVQVMRSQPVADVLASAASHLKAIGAGEFVVDAGLGSLCFVAQVKHGGHVLHVTPTSTVESENLFVYVSLLMLCLCVCVFFTRFLPPPPPTAPPLAPRLTFALHYLTFI
jgi:hypothetical protein